MNENYCEDGCVSNTGMKLGAGKGLLGSPKQNRYFEIIKDCTGIVRDIENRIAFVSNQSPSLNETEPCPETELEANLMQLREKLAQVRNSIID